MCTLHAALVSPVPSLCHPRMPDLLPLCSVTTAVGMHSGEKDGSQLSRGWQRCCHHS